MAALAALWASPAMAAFPGHNGMLAVAPLQGPGVLVMSSHGAGQHLICPQSGSCPVVGSPRWSPDGQAITYSGPAAQGISVIYDDGSCLDCQPFGTPPYSSIGASMPAFTSTPALLSLIAGGALVEFGSDGLQKQTVLSGHVSDAVWSAEGELAVVQSGRVLAGRPGHLHSLGRGSNPSWAPGGSRLALVRRGWVTVVRVGHHAVKRVARGSAPAFSPDGKWIAFIGRGSRLSMVASAGGRVHRVRDIQARYVDWQPVTANPPSCAAPPGSATVASSPAARVTADRGPVPDFPDQGYTAPGYMGCLLSTGRERLLTRYDFQSIDDTSSGSDFLTIGNFAAFIEDDADPHYGGSGETVRVFDLGTGMESQSLGGQQAACGDYSYSCDSDADQLALNSEGFSAVHTSVTQLATTIASAAQVTEQILAVDSTGMHVEDTVTESESGYNLPPPHLTDLQLTGDTLTWLHDGSPRTATLQ